jgi:hypothetical protein
VAEVRTGIKRERASEELQHAIERAHEGDESALPIIREHLAARDDGYWRLMAYARVVQSAQVKRYVGEGLFPQEVINERVKRLRKELQGEEPSPPGGSPSGAHNLVLVARQLCGERMYWRGRRRR